MNKTIAIAVSAIALAAVGSAPALAVPPSPGKVVFQKLDETGALLVGSNWSGESCTKFPGALEWTCTSLTDFGWFRRDIPTFGQATQFSDEIDMRGGWDEPIQHCLVLREDSAPEGYQLVEGELRICRGPGGWTAENADAAGFGGSIPDGWSVSNCERECGRTTVISLTNTPIPVPSPSPTPTETETAEPTPTPAPTESTPMESPSPSASAEPTPTKTPEPAPTQTTESVAPLPVTTSRPDEPRPLADTGAA